MSMSKGELLQAKLRRAAQGRGKRLKTIRNKSVQLCFAI